MQNKLILCLLGFACLAVSCKTPVYEPDYAVCAKITDYPEMAATGYKYIELAVGDFLMPGESDLTFQAMLNQAKQIDAKIISCVNFIPGHMSIVGPTPRHEEILVWARIVFSRAQKAGISYIVFGSGKARQIPEGFDRQAAKEQFITLCKRLAPLAQKYKVTIVIEPLNTSETNIINSLQEGVEIIKEVDNTNVRLLCDIYHMMRENEPATEIVKYGSYIRHCHIAEKESRTAPGTKGDDFTPYFNALRQINYQGCLSIEGKWDNMDERLAPALKYMKQQFEAL